jgi:hypothetical protein
MSEDHPKEKAHEARSEEVESPEVEDEEENSWSPSDDEEPDDSVEGIERNR